MPYLTNTGCQHRVPYSGTNLPMQGCVEWLVAIQNNEERRHDTTALAVVAEQHHQIRQQRNICCYRPEWAESLVCLVERLPWASY